jgi:hypothetical protein
MYLARLGAVAPTRKARPRLRGWRAQPAAAVSAMSAFAVYAYLDNYILDTAHVACGYRTCQNTLRAFNMLLNAHAVFHGSSLPALQRKQCRALEF